MWKPQTLDPESIVGSLLLAVIVNAIARPPESNQSQALKVWKSWHFIVDDGARLGRVEGFVILHSL